MPAAIPLFAQQLKLKATSNGVVNSVSVDGTSGNLKITAPSAFEVTGSLLLWDGVSANINVLTKFTDIVASVVTVSDGLAAEVTNRAAAITQASSDLDDMMALARQELQGNIMNDVNDLIATASTAFADADTALSATLTTAYEAAIAAAAVTTTSEIATAQTAAVASAATYTDQREAAIRAVGFLEPADLVNIESRLDDIEAYINSVS
jgi:hypothetical protein